jgi:hypothetical protein
MILVVYIVFIILALAGLGWLKQVLRQANLYRILKRLFKRSHIRPPTMKMGSSYSWPTFHITFSTKEDLELAEVNGLINQFKERLKSRYGGDFDPDMAVYCKYVGQVPEWKEIIDNLRK